MKKGKRQVFTDNERSLGTVLLNWHGTPEGEFGLFASAFHRVASDSVKGLRERGRLRRYGSGTETFRAYPVVFLYRHALELYMKAVILTGAPMLRLKSVPDVNRDKLLKTHNLDALRKDLERVFEAYEWDWDLGSPYFRSLADFRRTIAELHAVDRGSYAFRYPVDPQGAASLESHFRFNLFQFSDVLDHLLRALEGADLAAHEELQAMLEMMAEDGGFGRE